jgi:hypothetical protein
MTLEEEIEKRKREIHTDAYSMSIGEIASLYRDREIDIHPEFQRVYRWENSQKTKLIESILLGIPLPSIFVSQREDGKWDVIDGVQRLSTIFQFMGIFRDDSGKNVDALVLRGTEYLPSFEGARWNDPSGSQFTTNLQLRFKREKLDLKIIKSESDPNAKYDLFERLNSLGTNLSDQELRNNLLIMVNRDFYEWLRKMSEDSNFREAISISENDEKQQFDMELVLRFFVYKNSPVEELKKLSEIGIFLRKKMLEYAQGSGFNLKSESEAFRETFKLIYHSLGEDAFKKYYPQEKKFKQKFLVSVYEVVAVGLGYNILQWQQISGYEAIQKIRQIVTELWQNTEFVNNMGAGTNLARRVSKLVTLGKELFRIK